jgi:ABC-type transport system substrate-binding protein
MLNVQLRVGRLMRAAAVGATVVLASTCGLAQGAEQGQGKKVLQMPMRTDGPKSLDPVRGSTQYDNIAIVQVYEPLLQYKYLKRPSELEPLLLEKMPEISADGKTWSFTLKKGIKFHDHPAFPGGKGRELKAQDVFYSWKRMADDANLPKSWWVFEDIIEGFDEYRTEQNTKAKGGGKFDYDAPVSGMKIKGDYAFDVVLKQPIQQFQWKLAQFQTAVVAREVVDAEGANFGARPIGTGAFILDKWEPGVSISFNKNPNYHGAPYPSELPDDPELAKADKERGLDKPAGTPVPIVDRLEYTMFVQDQPMYLQFRAGKIGCVETPAEYQLELFNKRTKKLKPEFRKEGMEGYPLPLLDFIFDGFNMEDKLVGGYTPEKKALRQAISLALDYNELNDAFYNSLNIVYDGMIPPQLAGHPKDGKSPAAYRGPDIQRAKDLLKKAGYPDGKGPDGKQLVIDYYTSQGGNNQEQSEMRKRQLARIGVELKVNLVDFSTLIEKINRKGGQMFSFAWGSDYPDGENNLALFYGPNESPGSNHYNYKNAEFDALYQKARVMKESPERTAMYEKMRDMVLEDVPYCGSMARTRFYAINPWMKNYKPSEDFFNWTKYIDVDDSKRKQ